MKDTILAAVLPGVELLNMSEPIKLTLGDGSIIVGQTLEEAERKLAALKKQTPRLETQISMLRD